MSNKSRFDPSRATVGSIYRDAQFGNHSGLIVGDVNYEIRKGLVEDINKAIQDATKTLEGRPFYIAIYEKWILTMKKALDRNIRVTLYRPYPEANSQVYRVIPSSEKVFFCWELPERHHMMNELANESLYDPEKLAKYRRWENMQLEHFGFMKNDEGNWIENPMYRGDVCVSTRRENETVSMSKTEALAGDSLVVS